MQNQLPCNPEKWDTSKPCHFSFNVYFFFNRFDLFLMKKNKLNLKRRTQAGKNYFSNIQKESQEYDSKQLFLINVFIPL